MRFIREGFNCARYGREKGNPELVPNLGESMNPQSASVMLSARLEPAGSRRRKVSWPTAAPVASHEPTQTPKFMPPAGASAAIYQSKSTPRTTRWCGRHFWSKRATKHPECVANLLVFARRGAAVPFARNQRVLPSSGGDCGIPGSFAFAFEALIRAARRAKSIKVKLHQLHKR